MAQEKKKKSEAKNAKLAFRERTTNQDGPQKRFSTRAEDVMKILSDGRILAKTPEGTYYFTSAFYTKSDLADPNRYGRPASIVSSEEAAALLQGSDSFVS